MFNKYIAYFKRPEVTVEVIIKIVLQSFEALISPYYTKKEVLNAFIKFWNVLKSRKEQPIFT